MLFPTEITGQGGLLSPEIDDQIKKQTLLSLGLGLLQGSGPSLTPTSFGQVFGQAGMNAMSQGQSLRDRAIQRALLGRQVAKEDKRTQQEEDERRRQEQARQSALGVLPENLRESFLLDPSTAAAAASLASSSQQSVKPDFKIIETTLADGRKIKGRIDVNSPDPASTFVPVGAPTEEPIPVEAAGRLGLAQAFLQDLPELKKEIEAGKLTGAVDVAAARRGIGESGRLYARIESGVDALRRTLTGAGMPMDEAEQYVRRYQPSYYDTQKTLLEKMGQLERELTGNINAIMRGRGGSLDIAPRQPSATGDFGNAVNWSDL